MSLASNRVQIMNDHNHYRARHGAQPLRFDEGLNSSAQQYAERLAWQDGGLIHSSGNYGENLLFYSAGSPTQATTLWYDEVSLYIYGTGYSPSTAHFTQIVWRGSTSLGVGIATSGSGRTYVVAHYYPQGNMADQFTANVLPPQSQIQPQQSQNSGTAAPSVTVNQSANVTGQRAIKCFDNKYLRVWQGPEGNSDWNVDKSPNKKMCGHWYIQEYIGKVVIRAYCSGGKFLRARDDRRVDLADQPLAWEMWTPVDNGDGTWSFRSHHNTWLSAHRDDGIICAMPHNKECERFRLESL